ncbi:hypothetical protein [Paenibacillus sp. MMO-177]|uniref:hypothetical protein n=1 Tax=Paenibacillus sp. MMO-177 TaxID=3081289 RepID=UPI00301777FA
MAGTGVGNIFSGVTMDWGFSVSDIWSSSMGIFASLAGFIVLGMVVTFAPRLFGLVRKAVVGGGGRKG